MHPASCNNFPHLLLLLTLSHEHVLVLCASSLLQLCSPCHINTHRCYAQQVFCSSSQRPKYHVPSPPHLQIQADATIFTTHEPVTGCSPGLCHKMRLRRSPSLSSQQSPSSQLRSQSSRSRSTIVRSWSTTYDLPDPSDELHHQLCNPDGNHHHQPSSSSLASSHAPAYSFVLVWSPESGTIAQGRILDLYAFSHPKA